VRRNVSTDPILRGGVPSVVRRSSYSAHICIIFLVSNCTNLLRNAVQLVPDSFKGSVMVLNKDLGTWISEEMDSFCGGRRGMMMVSMGVNVSEVTWDITIS
jgi:hypothetical protein